MTTSTTYAKITRTVQMRRNGLPALTLEPGSVVTVERIAGDELTIKLARMVATVSIDDATPVEWDAAEQMWVEA